MLLSVQGRLAALEAAVSELPPPGPDFSFSFAYDFDAVVRRSPEVTRSREPGRKPSGERARWRRGKGSPQGVLF